MKKLNAPIFLGEDGSKIYVPATIFQKTKYKVPSLEVEKKIGHWNRLYFYFVGFILPAFIFVTLSKLPIAWTYMYIAFVIFVGVAAYFAMVKALTAGLEVTTVPVEQVQLSKIQKWIGKIRVPIAFLICLYVCLKSLPDIQENYFNGNQTALFSDFFNIFWLIFICYGVLSLPRDHPV